MPALLLLVIAIAFAMIAVATGHPLAWGVAIVAFVGAVALGVGALIRAGKSEAERAAEDDEQASWVRDGYPRPIVRGAATEPEIIANPYARDGYPRPIVRGAATEPEIIANPYAKL